MTPIAGSGGLINHGLLSLPFLSLSDVRELTWSIRTVATVSASPERVQSWWTHPDRKGDLRDRIQRNPVKGFSQTESAADGVGIRITRWKDQRGWVHETRVETPRDSHGRPLRNDDGSLPVSQHGTFRAPLGYKVIFTCTGRIEFNERGAGSTEVVIIHHHKAVGGTKFNRQHIRKSNEEREPQDFQEWIDRCRAELSPPVPQDSG